MKKNNLPTALSLLLSVLSITTFTLLTLAISGACCAHDFKTCESIITASDLPLEMVLPDSKLEIARSGCCSWHGGVCDCVLGRVVCCDGTISPSCLCYRETNLSLMDATRGLCLQVSNLRSLD